MIHTISPYSATRTAEIMSRYRPIAPKPESITAAGAGDGDNSGGLPNGISKSPYLRNVWANLQARPTRTRKRGRTAAFSPQSAKRARVGLQGLAPPYAVANSMAPMHGFSLVPLNCGLNKAVATLAESVAALPVLRFGSAAPPLAPPKGIDLNVTAEPTPEELDFLPQLQQPLKAVVISPRPVRPVSSTVTVERITVAVDSDHHRSPPQTAVELEEEIESETIPAIISDSNNKVRATNSAYNEMVGQPECSWLACAAGGACRRIGGDVSLCFVDSEPPMSVHGFTCQVRIEWKSQGVKHNTASSCAAVKIDCPAKDYQFVWRFGNIGSRESVLENLEFVNW